MSELKLRNHKVISDYGKPYIIAELGANHNGNMDLAKKMIDEAKSCGCDCVKFQSWSKSTVFSKKVYQDNYFLKDDYRDRKDYTLESIVEEFSISEQELFEMNKYCKSLDIDFSSTPFSRKEVDFLVDVCEVPFVKVASMDLNNYPFLAYIAKKNIPIILSTGLSTLGEIEKAIDIIEKNGCKKISILHCISIYPPREEIINLKNIIGLRTIFPEYPIGFSDHSVGVSIPSAAVALGACIIEKHFTLDKDMFGWDHKISANPDEMKIIVNYAKTINKALGTSRRVVSPEEIEKRDSFRRSIVTTGSLKAGHILTEKDLDLKRPGTGIAPERLLDLIGLKITRDYEFDELLKESDLKW